jgi:FkbM family methyltransferase
MSEVYVFGNGVRVRRRDLLDWQVARYTADGNPNLHEPVEEAWLLRSFAAAQPERPVFLDVGAGVGYYSLLIKARWPGAVVTAFEPLPRHAEALAANCQLNGLSPDDVTIVRAAVGPSSGRASFVDRGYSSGLDAGSSGDTASTVEMRSLSEVLTDAGPVHLLKMDIQGAELEVLTAGTPALVRAGVRHLVIGTHGDAIHRGVRDLLAEAGYTIELDEPSPPMQPDGLIVAAWPFFHAPAEV